MTSRRTRKPAPKKKRTARKKKSGSRFSFDLNISRIILFLALILFFFISIGAAGYVIFFRVVVAAELGRVQETSIACCDLITEPAESGQRAAAPEGNGAST